ncbi:hypothetical protein D6D10_05851 [Aureobasidium pullulans]|uniref:Microtubule associated protein n=1 Tax=Aureobasidium pullulans TaxID=5580 RepID=A0A4S9EUP5_AURPU|nr:hypothetical protein D6D10_05851 [Aureobasidium pullulans]
MDTGYLSQQVTTIINQLHGYFDEIGLPTHERDSRESELFAALSETLHNQLKLVAKEKHDLTDEARRLIKSIRQMEAALVDDKPQRDSDYQDSDLSITLPLRDCIVSLKDKYNTVSRIHRERYEQIKKLAEALESYASHLEPSFVTIKLPPTSPNSKIPPSFDVSPSYVTSLDNAFTRVYEEYNKRLVVVQTLTEEIIKLWGELGTPQAQIDSTIVKHARNAPEQLGLHQDDMSRLRAKKEKLLGEKQERAVRLEELKEAVETLWDKLGVEESDRKPFLASNRGCGLRAINEFEDELARLNELKRQNLHLFVEDARFKLQELWDGLYFCEEEMLEFTPAFSDVYSDALLEAHEAEIGRLEALKEQRAPTLAMVDKYRSLVKDRDDLAASSQDASRLMLRGQKGEKRDPTRLLREEKMRKRIAKELPKVESDLRQILEDWEEEYGRPFLVHGERYLDELEATSQKQSSQGSVRSKTPSIPPRSKTPSSVPPSTVRPKSAAAAAPTTAIKSQTLRGPPRSKTPTASRNPLASSVMGPPLSHSSSNSSFAASVGPGSLRSPSKIPGRQPLSSMLQSGTSTARRPPPGPLGHSRAESDTSTLRSRMAPPPRPMSRDFFSPPETPCPINNADISFERSGSIIRHMSPEDPYSDRSSLRSVRTFQSTASSRPASQATHHYVAAAPRPSPRFEYPAAPPPAAMSRQTSNASSVETSNSAVSGSENWETYTDASDDEEPDPRMAYYAKVRTNKRDSPEDSAYGGAGKGFGAKVRAIGVSDDGSETAWSDVGETF